MDPTLNEQYRELLNKFDAGAVRRKWGYQIVWTTITSLTWLTLLFAIIGTFVETTRYDEIHWLTRDTAKPLVNYSISIFGLVVIALTLAQTTLGLQGRWVAYRAAAERLRRTCMLYRARLHPFDGADADAVLAQTLNEVRDSADKQTAPKLWERFSWAKLKGLLLTPPDLRQRYPSTPEEGVAVGPLAKETEVLDGRLHNQRQWYVRKAGRYFRRYVAFQAAIVSCSLVNVLHVLIFGRIFVVVALANTLSLGLIACRDFLDYGPLFVRYVTTANSLKELETAYLNRHAPFNQGDEQERVKRLVEQVEQTLSNEFQYWYVTRR